MVKNLYSRLVYQLTITHLMEEVNIGRKINYTIPIKIYSCMPAQLWLDDMGSMIIVVTQILNDCCSLVSEMLIVNIDVLFCDNLGILNLDSLLIICCYYLQINERIELFWGIDNKNYTLLTFASFYLLDL